MARRYRYRAFPIAPGLNVMLTEVGLRLQGTHWSSLICFWRNIFEPYMPLRFGFVERHWSVLIRFWHSVVGAFFLFFFISSFLASSSTFSS